MMTTVCSGCDVRWNGSRNVTGCTTNHSTRLSVPCSWFHSRSGCTLVPRALFDIRLRCSGSQFAVYDNCSGTHASNSSERGIETASTKPGATPNEKGDPVGTVENAKIKVIFYDVEV